MAIEVNAVRPPGGGSTPLGHLECLVGFLDGALGISIDLALDHNRPRLCFPSEGKGSGYLPHYISFDTVDEAIQFCTAVEMMLVLARERQADRSPITQRRLKVAAYLLQAVDELLARDVSLERSRLIQLTMDYGQRAQVEASEVKPLLDCSLLEVFSNDNFHQE